MLGYGQKVGGMHPTGMHSCLKLQISIKAKVILYFLMYFLLYSIYKGIIDSWASHNDRLRTRGSVIDDIKPLLYSAFSMVTKTHVYYTETFWPQDITIGVSNLSVILKRIMRYRETEYYLTIVTSFSGLLFSTLWMSKFHSHKDKQ